MLRYQALGNMSQELIFFKVVAAVLFQEPLELHGRAKHFGHTPHTLTPRERHMFERARCMDGGIASEWLARTGQLLGYEAGGLDFTSVVFMWSPLAHLLLRGSMSVMGVARVGCQKHANAMYHSLPPTGGASPPHLELEWGRGVMSGSTCDEIAFMISCMEPKEACRTRRRSVSC